MSDQILLDFRKIGSNLSNEGQVESLNDQLKRHVEMSVENASKQIDRRIIGIAIVELLKKMPTGSFEMVKFEDGSVKVEFKRLKDQKWSKKEALTAKTDYEDELQQLIQNILTHNGR